jgi:hypothetical protein
MVLMGKAKGYLLTSQSLGFGFNCYSTVADIYRPTQFGDNLLDLYLPQC